MGDSRSSRRAALVGLLSSLAIATNYALTGLPNVNLMDLIVFLAGYSIGLLDGVAVALLSWLVYGTLNPYGFVPTIWIATSLSECLFALAGWSVRRIAIDLSQETQRVLLALAGFGATAAYDLLTNAVFAWTFGLSLKAALVAGIPFSLIHMLTNTASFSLLSPLGYAAIKRLFNSPPR